MTELDRNLAETWGPAATHSEYKRGDVVRYLVGSQTYTGTILWIAAPGDSHIEGHAPIATRHIIERAHWQGFPDVVYSSDILALEGPQEPVLMRCPYCGNYHASDPGRCPRNPNKP